MSKQEYPDTMRVGFFSPNIFREKGGVQRLSCELASYLASQGHCVSILHTGGGASPCFPLPDVVRTQNVGEDNGAVSVIHARQALLDHELDVFCVMGEVYAFLDFLPVCNRTGIPLILSEHAAPAVIEAMWGKKITMLFSLQQIAFTFCPRRFVMNFPRFCGSALGLFPMLCPVALYLNPKSN